MFFHWLINVSGIWKKIYLISYTSCCIQCNEEEGYHQHQQNHDHHHRKAPQMARTTRTLRLVFSWRQLSLFFSYYFLSGNSHPKKGFLSEARTPFSVLLKSRWRALYYYCPTNYIFIILFTYKKFIKSSLLLVIIFFALKILLLLILLMTSFRLWFSTSYFLHINTSFPHISVAVVINMEQIYSKRWTCWRE